MSEEKAKLSEEKGRILKMVEDGKISGEEARKLIGRLIEEKVESGVLKWSSMILFAFLPMILAIGAGLGVLYCLFFYLPFQLPFEKMAIVYGLVAIIILALTLVCVAGIGVGRKAVSRLKKVGSEKSGVEFESPEKDKPADKTS